MEEITWYREMVLRFSAKGLGTVVDERNNSFDASVFVLRFNTMSAYQTQPDISKCSFCVMDKAVVTQVTHSFLFKSTSAVLQSTIAPAKDSFCGDIPNARSPLLLLRCGLLLFLKWKLITANVSQLTSRSKVGRSGDISRRSIFSFD